MLYIEPLSDVIKNRITSLKKQYENASDDNDDENKINSTEGKNTMELSMKPGNIPIMNRKTISKIIGNLQLTDFMINMLNDY